MANVLLSAVTEKYTLIIILSVLTIGQIGFAVRECVKKPRKENFYLLSVRLIHAAQCCSSFDELDAVKAEFFNTFRRYGAHEDFNDCYKEVYNSIHNKFEELHHKNFQNGNI